MITGENCKMPVSQLATLHVSVLLVVDKHQRVALVAVVLTVAPVRSCVLASQLYCSLHVLTKFALLQATTAASTAQSVNLLAMRFMGVLTSCFLSAECRYVHPSMMASWRCCSCWCSQCCRPRLQPAQPSMSASQRCCSCSCARGAWTCETWAACPPRLRWCPLPK